MRSRSSTIASRWTCSCRRAFSIAIPAWTRERLDQPLVGRRELRGPGLVGEVQVADRAALHRDRARRGSCAWAGGSAGTRVAAGSTAMSGIRNERFSRDDQAEEARGRAAAVRSRLASRGVIPDVMKRSITP